MKKYAHALLSLTIFIVSVVIVKNFGSKDMPGKSSEAQPAILEQKTDQVADAVANIADIPEIIKEKTREFTGKEKSKDEYFLHKNISTTVFWVGEEAGKANGNISNVPSAWDENWVEHFGGIDDPRKRDGFSPKNFMPKENPFYFALPYNDFDKHGKRKREIFKLASWSDGKEWKNDESLCKNRWIEIRKGDRVAYAQWQDVGPFQENDKNYVFGKSRPKNRINKNAGLDVSPAVRDYLGLADIDNVDWKFIEERDVPDGPWKKIITTSQVYWE